MVDFVTAFATAAQALKLVQDIRELDKAIDRIDLNLKIAELKNSIADLKNTLTDAKLEIAKLEQDNRDLEELLSKLGDTVDVRGYKYLKGEDGNPRGHPICPVCVQKLGMFFHTTRTDMPGRPQQCPSCKALYQNVEIFLD